MKITYDTDDQSITIGDKKLQNNPHIGCSSCHFYSEDDVMEPDEAKVACAICEVFSGGWTEEPVVVLSKQEIADELNIKAANLVIIP